MTLPTLLAPRAAHVAMLAAVATTLVGAPPARAQSSPEGAPTLRAVAVEDGEVQLDGRLAEPAWGAAPVGTGFTQRDPVDGAPATERTEVRVVYSVEALYVAIRAFDSEPDEIRGRLARRDAGGGSDEVSVLIDSYADRRTSFEFAVTPRGAIRDVVRLNDGSGGDASWDPVWEVATAVDAEGWSAEFRIPFSQLRFDANGTTWGLQAYRRIERKAEDAWWAPWSKDSSGFTSLFGRLEGLSDLPSPKRLEIRPYTVANATFQPEGTGSDFAPARDGGFHAGLDLKMGITSDFTLDVTANPDFGQVEADPAVVNLTALETFLPEQRPFFVEGRGLLPDQQLFYSRRIGRSPQGFAEAPEDGTVEMPERATILGAAKVTGKSGAGLGIGIVGAVTASEHAVLRDEGGARVGRAPVEPRTQYFAARVSQDFAGGNHTVAVLGTGVRRAGSDDFPRLRSSALVASLEGTHRWRQNAYSLSWSMALSHVRGPAEAIAATQRSSSRYFQRPDAQHLEVDPTRTALTGTRFYVDAGKYSGSLRGWAGYGRTGPAFEVNDLGFLGSVDLHNVYAGGAYVRNQPVGPFRQFQLGPDFNWQQTTGGETLYTWFRPVFFNATFTNNWTLGVNPMAFQWDQFSVNALRGGPGLRDDTWHNSFVNVGTDGRRRVSLFVSANAGGVFGQDARFWGVHPTVTLRPTDALGATVGIGYNTRRNPQEWVTSQTVGDSIHYVLGTIDQRTVSVTARVDWTLRPTLSLQVYAQPFVSAGRYGRFVEVARPGAARFEDRFDPYDDRLTCQDGSCAVDVDGGDPEFTFSHPDFSARSLRSTAILRWEYRPGSVLFVGWQHARAGSFTDGGFHAGRDLYDLFDLEAENTLLIKASYWLSF